MVFTNSRSFSKCFSWWNRFICFRRYFWLKNILTAIFENALLNYKKIKIYIKLGLPQNTFAMAGAAQVCAKAFTSLALANGVAFPVVTLAKSGKMIPGIYI